MLLLINYSPVLKAPHSLRQINDVLIIVAVCEAPPGSANVRVGRNCAHQCVFLLQEHKQHKGKVGSALVLWKSGGARVLERGGRSRSFATFSF